MYILFFAKIFYLKEMFFHGCSILFVLLVFRLSSTTKKGILNCSFLKELKISHILFHQLSLLTQQPIFLIKDELSTV